MNVVTALLTISIPGTTSLKEKRRVVRSIIDRIRSHFNVAIAEVGHLDFYNSTQLGVAAVAGSLTQAREVATEVVRSIEEFLDLKGMGQAIEVIIDEY